MVVKIASSAPRLCASRAAAMFTAYESVLAPISSHGARCAAPESYPRSRVTTRMPFSRAAVKSAAGDAVIQAVGPLAGAPGPPICTPRLSSSLIVHSPWSGIAATARSTARLHCAMFGSGSSSSRADFASRSRCGAPCFALPSKTPIDSNTPSPRFALRSPTLSAGASGSICVIVESMSPVASAGTGLIRKANRVMLRPYAADRRTGPQKTPLGAWSARSGKNWSPGFAAARL